MENTIGQQFMIASRCENCGETDRQKKLPPPRAQVPADKSRMIRLPEPELLDDHQVNFLELVEVRTTVRKYQDKPLSLKELSYLLWCTQGVKMILESGLSRRNVPSAGSRHAFETYLLINRVEGLEAGLYRFLAMEHALVPVDVREGMGERMTDAFMRQPMIEACGVLFIWTAVIERTAYAYGPRAYRYVHLDAGHVCQNLYLSARTISCGTCAIAHFDDEKLNRALQIDGEAQFAIYAATVGK